MYNTACLLLYISGKGYSKLFEGGGGGSKAGKTESGGDCFNLPVGIFALPVIAFRLFEKLFSEKTVKTYSEQSLSPIGSEKIYLVVLTVTPSSTTLPLFIMVMT